MTKNKHIDMDAIVRQVIEKREEDTRVWNFEQVARYIREGEMEMSVTGSPHTSFHGAHAHVDVTKDYDFGPRQVQSFLQFMDNSLEREIELAEMDNIVYDSLKEHRILGRRKK